MDVLFLLKGLDTILVEANQVFIDNLVTLAYALLAFHYRKNNNIIFIISLILFPKVFDVLFLTKNILESYPSYAYFLIYSVYDFSIILLILYRENVMKLLYWIRLKVFIFLGLSYRNKITFEYVRHVNEIKIIIIFAISVLISLVVAAEYPLRWYVSKDILYFYYLYTPLKLGLNVALVYWVWSLRPLKQKYFLME